MLRPAQRTPLWVRLTAAVLSPLVFLLLAELCLNLLDYGLPRDFFISWTADGQTVHLANKDYCDHFVPAALSRAPEPSAVLAKQPGQFRIFVLGGSAANGDPVPAFGFCRQLEVVLNEHAKGVSFEVINVAVTSMNSFVALRIAGDCTAQHPDAFIVLMGNNEVIGPYGPPTLSPALYARRNLINACITAQKDSRVGQLLKQGLSVLHSAEDPGKKWMGMEAFLENQIRSDDNRLDHCYRHFQANLSDIVRLAHSVGAKTILCTVPTNLSACAPFGSQHLPDLTDDQQAQWDAYFQQGRLLEKAGDFSAALAEYANAARIDDTYADLVYSMGACLLALGRPQEAKAYYTKARDLDTLRFRADSRMNQGVQQVAQKLTGQGAILLDLEARLSAQADHGIPGADFFVDHVHFSFFGNFQNALAAMEVIREQIPAAQLMVPERSETQLLELCQQRLLYDMKEQYRLAMVMYRRKTLPPFTDQLGHERELDELGQELFNLRRRSMGQGETEAAYRAALEHARFDSYLNQRYGEFLVKRGDFSQAMRLFATVLETRPHDRAIRSALARALAQGGSQAEAIEVLCSADTAQAYTRKEALLMLGTFYLRIGRIKEAGTVYQELYTLEPDNPDVLINLASAASHQKDYAAMKGYLERVLAIAPKTVEAMINMGNYYVKTEQSEPAHTWFLKAVETDPYNPMAHIGLGLQCIRQRQLDKGLGHVKRAIRLKPDFAQGYQVLEKVYRGLGKQEEAQSYARLGSFFALNTNE